MTKPLRVLLIEDFESDAELIERILVKAGLGPICERVETADQMKAALGKQPWDIVISDYRLPSFNAPAALELLQQAGLDIPFIVVSGMIGEELAVAMMKAGAADYVMKNNLSRLGPAVERELRDAQTRHERKRAGEDLAAEKERLLVTLRSIGDGVITTNVCGAITLMNKVAEDLTGWSLLEAINRPLVEVFNIINEKTREKCENPVEKVLATGAIIGLANHTALLRRDGTECSIADSGAPIRDGNGNVIGVVLVFRDVTDQQKIDKALQNSEKLQALGVLAGGIAHDFNNFLNGIFGYIELAMQYCETKKCEQVCSCLTSARAILPRAKDLTLQLLTFAKGGKPFKKSTSLVPILKKSAQFVLSGSNIALEFDLPSDLWLCMVDENQIGRVIDNLVINAREAMPNGGTITILAKNVHKNSLPSSSLDPGDYVRIAVSDTGTGIPKELLSQIYDPFFSTKHLGNGLGLATVYSIIKNHDGLIEVNSDPRKGTTFFLFFPRSKKIEDTTISVEPHQNSQGHGKILVMDDEVSIRELATIILENAGYVVQCAKNGDEAVELFRKAHNSSQPFSLVILDLTVPGGKGGREIISELQRLDAHINVIASSGYSEDPIMSSPSDYGFTDRLVKPYSLGDLIQMVKQYEKS